MNEESPASGCIAGRVTMLKKPSRGLVRKEVIENRHQEAIPGENGASGRRGGMDSDTKGRLELVSWERLSGRLSKGGLTKENWSIPPRESNQRGASQHTNSETP